LELNLYRNKKLTHDIPKALTVCMSCGLDVGCGGIVGAHSNQLRDRKGRGLKAHDYRIAYLCLQCHMEIDQGKKTHEEKISLWEEAHRKTIGYLFETGHIIMKEKP
jgi:hypothetical protein